MAQRLTLSERAAVHRALAEPVRLAIFDELMISDRSPSELSGAFEIPSNLLSHHLSVLEDAGVVERFSSAGDRRRKYVRLIPRALDGLIAPVPRGPRPALFVCSHNSARSQIAAALWRSHTGAAATSAGTRPAAHVHRGAVAAAARVGLDLSDSVPRAFDPAETADGVVITVCDQAHEELAPDPTWLHWSIPDPVARGTPEAFDKAVTQIGERIERLAGSSAPPTW